MNSCHSAVHFRHWSWMTLSFTQGFSSACQTLVLDDTIHHTGIQQCMSGTGPGWHYPSHRDSVVHVRHWSWMTLSFTQGFSSACQALVLDDTILHTGIQHCMSSTGPGWHYPSHRDSAVHVRHWSWMTLSFTQGFSSTCQALVLDDTILHTGIQQCMSGTGPGWHFPSHGIRCCYLTKACQIKVSNIGISN